MGNKLLLSAVGCVLLAAGGGVLFLRTHGLRFLAYHSVLGPRRGKPGQGFGTRPRRGAGLLRRPLRHLSRVPPRWEVDARRGHVPAAGVRGPATQALTDGEIMNVIRKGVRFTGMPGFSGTDKENGKLAHFVRHLSSLSDAQLSQTNEINHLEGTTHEEHH